MMTAPRIAHLLRIGLAAATLTALNASFAVAQPARTPEPAVAAAAAADQPDAERTKQDLTSLLERYPPTLRRTLALDPALLNNQPYLAPYPALAGFLAAHPEIARNPSFYLGRWDEPLTPRDPGLAIWEGFVQALAVLTGLGMTVGLVVWLIKTLVDYRRWSRLAIVQTNAHTKLLDRFTANDELLAYIQSPAGSRFLQSTPISLDAAPRALGAPLARILWSVQGGVVLLAAGIGLQVVSSRTTSTSAEPINALGILAICLGVGFIVSAVISYAISYRLGLLEPPPAARNELPSA